MIKPGALLVTSIIASLAIGVSAHAAGGEEECNLTPQASCFGLESLQASLSTTQAGDHPDLTFGFAVKQDPASEPNVFGLKDAYAPTRDVRIELPPGLIGNPNLLGVPQQCTTEEFLAEACPNGSQVGVTSIAAYSLLLKFHEPIYMMQPPGGDVVARLGFIAGLYPTFIDVRVRSGGDFGLTSELTDVTAAAKLIESETTIWGVPADHSHDDERCTPAEAFVGCAISPPRPPGARPLAFLTNPTRCGVTLSMSVNASSWAEPELQDKNKKEAFFPQITGCDGLPFGPSLTASATSRHTASPTGLDMTIKLPEADGVKVLEPAQIRDIKIDLPAGIGINPGSADGLGVCSVAQVHFGEDVASECPDNAKLANTEFEVSALPRRMKGAIYLREPEPGNLFRIWVVADDLGAHVKLAGQLEVDRSNGQIKSVVLDSPQVPLREAKLLFKSGFRAPLMTPLACGAYLTHYEFLSWAGGPAAKGAVPMQVDEGCGAGGFDPQLQAGSSDANGGAYSPFTFTINRQDGQQNLSGLDITLPEGVAASFVGIPRCEGADAESGHCPPASRIGKTVVADGAGPSPLWVPQPGKDPTAVYLSGPYKGAPLSIVAVVPAQAGPFDLGLEVVRSAVYVNSVTAQATAKADPLPQIIEGIPITYKAVNVQLDRLRFTLNPTSCAQKRTVARLTSTTGQVANPSSRYAASNCAKLAFEPKLALRLLGRTHRGEHPRLRATLRMPSGGANIAATSVNLPRSEFIENAHFKTICTRVQFAAKACPSGSIYGHAVARTRILEQPLEGPVYLRSSSSQLPDLVMALRGPASMPIEIDLVGHVDSANGGLRATFETVPDAPVKEFTLRMQGGKKGLIVNSTNLCASNNRATAKFHAQNGKDVVLHPALRASCGSRAGKSRNSRSPDEGG
jgi:hypothetical protein